MVKAKLSKQKNSLNKILTIFKKKSFESLISNNIVRKRLIKLADRKIYQMLLQDNNYPKKVQEDKYYMARNLVLAMNKAFEQADKAPAVRKALINVFALNIFLKEKPQIKRFEEDFGREPPSFLAISPGKFCNLKCAGCYANSSPSASENLDWDVLDRIITEKVKLWGSYFTVISGGEPLLYKSQGKTIIDLAQKHQDNYFLMFTNGTLIDKKMVKKLAKVGNITPAISVEGFEKETDTRRGVHIHKRIMETMKNLVEAGVPFGISLTATRNNAELLDDKFANFYFNECGAVYGWVFQLMPIGRANCLDLMVSPEQRLAMFRRTQHLVKDRKIFIADFWNNGCITDGCISAGKPGGYLYIEWNGNVTPCVFNPYSPVNINEIYKKGGTLNDVLKEPFFESIRQWQKDYALNKKSNEIGNWLAPCAIKDHYKMMEKLLEKYSPKPINEAAQRALNDKEYKKGLRAYGEKVMEATDSVWKIEYLKMNG